MVKQIKFLAVMLLLTVWILGCNKDKRTEPEGYDIDLLGIPRFVRINFVDPTRMVRISKFRSAYGTDYSDSFEHCRSMKHAFEPRSIFDWSTLPLFSPVNGKIIQLNNETFGSQICIKSSEFPDFEFRIFHVNPMDEMIIGKSVKAGQQIGTHFGQQILPEIAVGVSTPKGFKLVSYFDVMKDSLLWLYNLGGDYSRQYFIISREERNQNPLTCNGETFSDKGTLDDWMYLNYRYDVDAWGIPKFVKVHYLDFNRIWAISRFRSSVGHDYSDDFEHCRSMKHYFQPAGDTGWETVHIYAPVTGTISWLLEESQGTQVWIRSQEYTDFEFGIFHINMKNPLTLGQTITAGQLLGTHISSRTYSDIAVVVHTPSGRKLISWFDTLTDSLFQEYQARGLTKRGDMIITKEQRDINPLSCSGETFLPGADSYENWIYLKKK